MIEFTIGNNFVKIKLNFINVDCFYFFLINQLIFSSIYFEFFFSFSSFLLFFLKLFESNFVLTIFNLISFLLLSKLDFLLFLRQTVLLVKSSLKNTCIDHDQKIIILTYFKLFQRLILRSDKETFL